MNPIRENQRRFPVWKYKKIVRVRHDQFLPVGEVEFDGAKLLAAQGFNEVFGIHARNASRFAGHWQVSADDSSALHSHSAIAKLAPLRFFLRPT